MGETLAEFRAANPGRIRMWTRQPTRREAKGPAPIVNTPLCTDEYSRFEGDDGTTAPGEVLCNASPTGGSFAEGKVVNGRVVDQILYSFYKGRLYRIVVALPSDQFLDLHLAFVQKYGGPAKTQLLPMTWQNIFGAHWNGNSFGWRNGAQVIALIEGPGNGPGQLAADPRNDSLAVFLDETLAPPAGEAKPLDF